MKQRTVSYLDTLKFQDSLYNSFPGKYLSNFRIPLLIILSVILIGVVAFVSIPKRLNPEIKIPIVIVSTLLPGAGPDDVESLVTIPLERELSDAEGLDVMNSTSRESISIITLQFVSSKNADEAVSDIQKTIDRVNTLPEEAQTPSVQSLDFENQPVWTFAITSKSDTASLMRFAEDLKTQIENVDRVDRVETSGLDDQIIEVVVDLNKAKEFNISPIAISSLIQSSAKSFPGGSVNSSSSVFSLTLNREINNIEDIRNLTIKSEGNIVKLSDITNISQRSKSGQTNTYIADREQLPKNAVVFFVFKKSTADIDKSFQAAEPVVNELIKKYDGQFTLYSIQNTADLIDEQFGDLNSEFVNTSILVFLLLFVFLGLRQGIISNVTVPLTFLGTFAVIRSLNLSLNFLTVFSLLLTLGILIDDTIVVVAAMTRYYKTGKFTPYQTGIMVWRDFIVPLWSSAITTIWGFVPLLLSSGIIGEFIKSIPIVVTTTMIISTLISVMITIPLMIIFLKPEFPKRVKSLFTILGFILYFIVFVLILPKNILFPIALIASLALLVITYRFRKYLKLKISNYFKKNKRAKNLLKKFNYLADHGVVNIEILSARYRVVIEKILRSKVARRQTIIAIAAFTVIAYLLLPLGLVKNEFFPREDAELLYATVDLPPGTNSELVNAQTLKVADILKKTEELDYLVVEVGKKIQSTGDREQSPESVLFTLHLTKPEKRALTSSDIAQQVRDEFASFSQGQFSVIEQSGGPPAGADIQIQFLGEDLALLDQYADKITDYLKSQTGVINIDKSIKPGTSKVVFVPDKSKITQVGLTPDQIGLWLRTYASGFTLDSILFGKDEKDIVFRINSYDHKPIEELSAIEIPLMGTQGSVPLSSLGTFRLEANPTIITREDEKRSISIFGSVIAGVNIPEKNAQLLKYANSLDLPDGYEWKTGGVNEENQKSVNSILQSMGLAFLLILVTMVIEFSSFRQAFIAMLMIPISVAGVLYIFALVRTPLSFAALIGVLALFGIVMRHAIVVLEKINENRKHGLSLHDAIADAASSRLEPVLLTSLATIVALIPITISDPFWRGLGGAIIAGLLFTGALKLFIVPVLYFNFYKDEEKG